MTGNHIGTGGLPAIEDAASGGEVQERFRGMKLTEVERLTGIICDLFAPDGHSDGCLYKANHNFPCQCDRPERMERYFKAVNEAKAIRAALKARCD